MPRYQVEHDGQTFEVEAPNEAALAQAVGQLPHKTSVSQVEAALRGISSGVSFGFADELAGLQRVGAQTVGMPQAKNGGVLDAAVSLADMSPMSLGSILRSVGAVRLAYDHLPGVNSDGQSTQEYEKGRDEVRHAQDSSGRDFPKTYLAGEIGGSLLIPVGGEARAATLAARAARSAKAGAVIGGVTGVGEGEGVRDSAQRGAVGLAGGAALGGLAAPIVEGVARVAAPVASKLTAPISNTARSIFKPREEAARQVVTAVERDIKSDPDAATRLTPQEFNDAKAAGIPVVAADMGGGLTRRLADVAAITSPEAETALKTAINDRFEGQALRTAESVRDLAGDPPATQPQSVRFGQIIRNVAGGADATADLEQLQQAARAANRPAYQRAYEVGDRAVWSPELERLTSAPSIRQAMQAAVNKWKDWQVVDGFGGMNPGAMVENGTLSFSRGRFGVPAFPNLQFWDYTARNIADKAEAARRSGRTQLAAQLGGLERQLKRELDRAVPEYRAARTGAAAFFGANDALEAGRLFVRSSANIGQARAAINRMSAPEREMFARGFASELADNVERVGDRSGVLNSPFFSSAAGRQRLALALGPDRAAQFEQGIASDRLFHGFGGATNAFEAGQNFVGGGARWRSSQDVASTRTALARMSEQEREAFRSGYIEQFIAKLGSHGDRRSVLNQIFQSPAARAEIRMAIGQERANELEARMRVEGIMDLLRNAVSGNSWTARRLYDVGLAGGAGLGLTGTYQTDPKEIAIGGVIAALSSGGRRVNANVMRHVAQLLVSGDVKQLAKGVRIVSRNPVMLDALRAADHRIANAAAEQSSNLPAIQAGGVSRADDNQQGVKRPPSQ